MLEALIAIGILGICLIPLLDFQIQVSDGAARLGRQQAMSDTEARAISYLHALPVSMLDGGEVDLGDAVLTWRPARTARIRRVISGQQAPGRFDLALVRLEYELRRGETVDRRGTVDRLTWQAIGPFFD